MEDKKNVIHIEPKKPNWFIKAINETISTLSRRIGDNLFGISKNGKRDLNEAYGYNKTPKFKDFYWMYRRGGLSFRVVNSLARSCWRDGISLLKGDDLVLEDELKVLNKHGKLTKRLEQADILNRIGSYSVLYIGIPDGLKPDKPLGKAKPDQLDKVFFRPYSENGITVHKYVDDPTDPRHGLPEIYTLQVNQNTNSSEITAVVSAFQVHHTRLVHLAEGALDNDIEGISALEPILNALEDMVKTAGGSAEAYFRNARGKFSLQVKPEFAASFSPEQKKALEAEAQAFQDEYRDFIRAGGIDVKQLHTQHESPLDTFMVLLKIVSGTTGIPIRILTGEGAGQLAGNEDKESYNQLVQDRKELWCTDWAMQVLMVLEMAGMIELDEDAEIMWPAPEVVSPKEKGSIAKDKASALNDVSAALSHPSLDGRLEPEDALKLVFGEDEVAEVELKEIDDTDLPDSTLEDAEDADLDMEDEEEVDDVPED